MAVSSERAQSMKQALEATPRPAKPVAARVQILGSYIALLGLALVLGLLLQRGLLLARLNQDVNAQLRQETQELQQLSSGRDPNTGQPFGRNVTAIFDTFLRRNIPIEGEALFTIVDGRPHASTLTRVQLLDDPAIVELWAGVTEPTPGEIRTSAGEVRYLAVPVYDEARVAGVFVVAIFLDEKRAELDRIVQLSGAAYLGVFAIASAFAWIAAGRVLRPVRLVTDAARSITEQDLSGRIPVHGDDEIAELARTFNDMLDRLASAFSTQRRFIDDAGHELRTPITIIRGHLELMGSDPAEREVVLRLVTDELGRMSRIVDDLLLLAVAEQPDFLDPHPIDAAELTSDVLAKSVALSGDRRWALHELAPVVLVADRQRRTQALMNLTRNAVEHSTTGSAISVGSRAVGAEVHFSVPGPGQGRRACRPRAHLRALRPWRRQGAAVRGRGPGTCDRADHRGSAWRPCLVRARGRRGLGVRHRRAGIAFGG